MFDALGFDRILLHLVQMFLRYTFVVLTMNGIYFESITLAQSIHQGYPLAPSLFMLAIEAFNYLLAHQDSLRLLKGIALPNSQVQILNGHFIDDSFLTLREDEKSIKNALKCLDTFLLALASRIQ